MEESKGDCIPRRKRHHRQVRLILSSSRVWPCSNHFCKKVKHKTYRPFLGRSSSLSQNDPQTGPQRAYAGRSPVRILDAPASRLRRRNDDFRVSRNENNTAHTMQTGSSRKVPGADRWRRKQLITSAEANDNLRTFHKGVKTQSLIIFFRIEKQK